MSVLIVIFWFVRLVFRIWDGMASLGTRTLPSFTAVIAVLLGRKDYAKCDKKKRQGMSVLTAAKVLRTRPEKTSLSVQSPELHLCISMVSFV